MVYLLQDCYKDDNGAYHDILKIGFCRGEDFENSRGKAYNTHNFGYKLISIIKHGAKDLETELHNKFKHLRLSPDSEWFQYSEEILKEFEEQNKLWNIGDIENFEQLIREIFYKGVTSSYYHINSENYINDIFLDKYNFSGMIKEGYLYETYEALSIIRSISKEITDTYLEYYKTLKIEGLEKISDLEYNVILNNTINEEDIRSFSILSSGIKYNIKYSIKNIDPFISTRNKFQKRVENTYSLIKNYRGCSDDIELASKRIILNHTFASSDITAQPHFNYQLLFLGRRVIHKLESFIDRYMLEAAKTGSSLITGKYDKS